MSFADAISRVSQIETQIASLTTPAAASPQAQQTAQASAQSTSTTPTSFASALSAAQTPAASGVSTTSLTSLPTLSSGAPTVSASPATGSSTAPQSALLTPSQQQFATQLSARTGMNSGVVDAWVLAEESGSAATSRAAAGNNDWLNIGYTDSATYGAGDSTWSSPITAANATASWLKGEDSIPGYGAASTGVQAILSTAGQSPPAQIAAIQRSGWASSGYPDLPSIYAEVTS
jgi:hypothetical protein